MSATTKNAAPRGPQLSAWLRDDPETHDAIREGRDVEVVATAYGQNDFLLV